MSVNNDLLINEFLIESSENLGRVYEELTQLEKDPGNVELLGSIYRTVHTMKGSASFLGYQKLQEITHHSENLLDKLREQELVLGPELTDLLFKAFDLFKLILKQIEDKKEEGEVSTEELKLQLALAYESPDEFLAKAQESLREVKSSPKQAPASVEEISHQEGATNEELNDEDFELSSLIAEHQGDGDESEDAGDPESGEGEISDAALATLKEQIEAGVLDASILDEFAPKAEKVEEEIEEVQSSEQQQTAKLDLEKAPVLRPTEKEDSLLDKGPKKTEESSKVSIADSIVRVQVQTLDRIMNIVGELVLNRNQIVQYASQENNGELSRLTQSLNAITSELQSEVMSTRMQPIGSVLAKFERLVRDFARENDKGIRLQMSGQETELDKTLLDAIKDPLVHIIRNSADHGIEDRQTRIQAGKDETGTISIRSYNESGQVTIEIKDDGRGIEASKIRQKAIEKEFISQDEANNLDDEQVLQLLFEPGFSTAEKITNISGRGVGMDVVRTNLEKIRGTISIQTGPGEGTTFKLKIPLTLAIVPALIIRSEKEYFAIPQLNLVELVRLESPEELEQITKIQNVEFLRLRGELTPLIRLKNTIQIEREASANESGQGTDENLNNGENIVILQSENKIFGIVVDDILDTEEIVVKPLGRALKKLQVFGGATIMGDGHVALILDAAGLRQKIEKEHDRQSKKSRSERPVEAATFDSTEAFESLSLRLADGRQYAVPLSLVFRLEEFERKHLDKTGKTWLTEYNGRPLPLIEVEESLGLGVKSCLHDTEEFSQKVPCIVVKIRDKLYGLCVHEILDISIDTVEIDSSAVDRDGILGTVFFGEKTVSVLDLYTLIESQIFYQKVEEEKQGPQNEPVKVLLVDDSSLYRKMGEDALSSLGHHVVLAKDGKEGIKVLKENPDVKFVVTDIEMPHLDGFGFASAIRAEQSTQNIPIIAMSTRVSAEDKAKGKESGFTYHLEKFKKEEFHKAIALVLAA